MSLCVIDLLQIIYIKYNNSKVCYTIHFYLCIESFFIYSISITILDTCKSIDVGLYSCLCKTPSILFLLTNLSIYIIYTDYKSWSFTFFKK